MKTSRALLLIDLQLDYFPGGLFPLWNPADVLECVKRAIALAQENDCGVIHVQHLANPEAGIAPFFNRGTEGAEIHPEIMSAAPAAPVVVKEYADSFHQTNLEALLDEWGVEDLFLCGMMTQNCVTHTALSKRAERYRVSVLSDACTSVSEAIHLIALHAL